VPADTVRRVVADLIQYGKVRRPWVGVYGQDIDPQLAGYLKLPEENGVLVAYVEPGSSASQAGIRGGTQRVRLGFSRLIIGGDFIVAVDERAVTGQADFTSYLLNKNLGETVTVTLYRDGRKIRLPVKLIGKERSYQM
jgi:S1-C subfamily serine protease